MATASLLKTRLSADELNTLTTVSNILHLVHHRNKNQHRRAHWYRPFSLFRRHVARLAMLHAALHATPTTHAARHRKLAEDRETSTKAQAEALYLADVLMPRCERTLGQLIAEQRYAVLGVVLFAVIAQVSSLLGVTAALEDGAEREVRAVLERFERETWDGRSEGGLAKRETMVESDDTGVDDIGVVIERGVGERSEAVEAMAAVARLEAPKPRESRPGALAGPTAERLAKRKGKLHDEKNKKRRKKPAGDDAIDDLFAGL